MPPDYDRAMRVGWIGLGIMGSRMAANLRRAGHELVVCNRTRETAEAWAAEHGAEVVATPAGIEAEVVITMLVDGEQVEAALLGAEGAASGAGERTLFVDMSTIGPEAARAIGGRLPAFVDAPVTGSSPKAQDGTLTIMAGGEREHVRRAWPLFEAMGELIVYAGPLGHGQQIKVINNAVAAVNTDTVAQALLVGQATGVDLDALVAVMGAGSGGSAMLALKAEPMRRHDYATLFKLEHMLKDVRLCLDSGQAAGVGFPAAAAVREVLSAAMGRGLGDADFAALLEVVEAAAGRRLAENR
jgi:3-hydroxyisobutyrate dehydrogenase-like beta-hydroxyacid dehydrogenase